MMEIQGKSILVQVSARFELARVRVIRSQLYIQFQLSLSAIAHTYTPALFSYLFRNVLNNLHVFSRLIIGNYFTLSPGSLQLSLALAESILIFSTLFFTTTATIKLVLNNNNIMMNLQQKSMNESSYSFSSSLVNVHCNCCDNPYLQVVQVSFTVEPSLELVPPVRNLMA